MTAPTDAGMVELIERLEKATGPDRELDYAIDHAVFQRAPRSIFTPKHTSSIDAALTLVPEDRELVLAHCKFEPVQCWEAILDTKDYDTDRRRGRRDIATAPTPALSICIAALRTRSPA